MIRLALTIFIAALLGACSSAVKLDNVPVEDKSGAAVSVKDPNAAGSGSREVVQVKPPEFNQDPATNNINRIVYFDFDSSAIRPEFQSVIEANGRMIRSNKSKKIVVEGHTDERGGREYNLALGQKRAEAVRRALVLLGGAQSQLEAVSFGKEKPAVLGSTEAAMEKNRRAEISYR